MSDDWLTGVAEAVQVDPALVDDEALLGLARDVAHTVERKAAPLSAFVLGYAAGTQGANVTEIAALIDRIRALCPPARGEGP